MYYNPEYYNNFTSGTSLTFAGVWGIVSLILAIIGGILVYYLFVKNKKETKNKYIDLLKDFLDFKKMLIEDLLKIVYIAVAIFITLFSFELISESFISFVLFLVLGNIIARFIFEELLVIIMIWKNTNELNKKVKKQ